MAVEVPSKRHVNAPTEPLPGADRRALAPVLLVPASVLLIGGCVAYLLGPRRWADVSWALATVLGIGPSARWVWLRARQHGLSADVVARSLSSALWSSRSTSLGRSSR